MTLPNKNKIKAAFLLTVFALNTVIAFACSVGLDMGYNKKHHQTGQAETAIALSHCEAKNSNGHHHNKAMAGHHEKNFPSKDDCCNKNAVELQQIDKNFSHAEKIDLSAPVLLLALQFAYNINLLHNGEGTSTNHYFVRTYHPPIPDIRVAIQSFQI